MILKRVLWGIAVTAVFMSSLLLAAATLVGNAALLVFHNFTLVFSEPVTLDELTVGLQILNGAIDQFNSRLHLMTVFIQVAMLVLFIGGICWGALFSLYKKDF